MKKEARVILFFSLAVFLMAFLVSGRFWFRIDMTRDRAFTISEISEKIFLEIDNLVTVTYFVSSRLARSHTIPGEIAEFLSEYSKKSNGRVRYIQRDPAQSALGRAAEELGILPWQIQLYEANEISHTTVYSGILIEYLNSEEVIPIVFSTETLEYDLGSRILSLIRNTNRELGILIGSSNLDFETDFSLLNYALLLSGYMPFLIERGSWIPSSLPAVFVLGGEEDLDIFDLLLINDYVRTGGNVFFALNGVNVDVWGNLEARSVVDSGLLAMLAGYGIAVNRNLVMDRASLTLTFQTQDLSGSRTESLRYPPWIAVQEQSLNQNHPVTRGALGPDLYWPSSLELFPPSGVRGEILFTSSEEAWLQTNNFFTNPNHISEFENERSSTGGRRILAASLEGIMPVNLFSGQYLLSDLPPSQINRVSRIIVIGDVNFAGSLMQTSRSEDRNLEFLVRSAAWLFNEEDLLPLRTRGQTGGRLDRIIDTELRNLYMSFSRILNTFIIPVFVIIFGFIVYHYRRKISGRRNVD